MEKELPDSWECIELRDVVVYKKGKKPNILKDEPYENAIPYLDIKALEKNEIRQYADLSSSMKLSDESIAIVWDGARSGWVAKGKAPFRSSHNHFNKSG